MYLTEKYDALCQCMCQDNKFFSDLFYADFKICCIVYKTVLWEKLYGMNDWLIFPHLPKTLDMFIFTTIKSSKAAEEQIEK